MVFRCAIRRTVCSSCEHGKRLSGWSNGWILMVRILPARRLPNSQVEGHYRLIGIWLRDAWKEFRLSLVKRERFELKAPTVTPVRMRNANFNKSPFERRAHWKAIESDPENAQKAGKSGRDDVRLIALLPMNYRLQVRCSNPSMFEAFQVRVICESFQARVICESFHVRIISYSSRFICKPFFHVRVVSSESRFGRIVSKEIHFKRDVSATFILIASHTHRRVLTSPVISHPFNCERSLISDQ